MRRGDIRGLLLTALLEGAAHGYELMGRLEAGSNGSWRPSPGSVYPTRQLREEQGLIRGREDNGKRVFELTDAGRTDAEAAPSRQPAVPQAQDQPSLRDSLEGLALAARQVSVAGSASQVEAATAVLTAARQQLYRLLADG